MQSVRGRRFLGDSVIYRDKLVKNSKIVLNPEGLNYRFDVFDQISRYMPRSLIPETLFFET